MNIVDKLCIVAHPDDEILWSGNNLSLQSGWLVICATHGNDPVRSKEFKKTMSYCAVTQCEMYNVPDNHEEETEPFENSLFEKRLKELSKNKWKLVLTHNKDGEYGHEHHIKVFELVSTYFKDCKQLQYFSIGSRLTNDEIVDKIDSLQFYKNTQNICKKLYEGKEKLLRKSEAEHFFNEKAFLKYNKKIPLIIHQIWFGNPLAKNSVRYNLMQLVKDVAKQNGFIYKIWTNDDLTVENFPITFDYIETSKEVGEELEQIRFAQVADLARYEILHRYGGVYLDSLFEIGKDFCKYIKKYCDQKLIVANEDPCGLDCNANEEYYISNGFFACISGCPMIKRILSTKSLDSIDFYSVYINRETGPYYFRKGILKKDKVHVIDTELIYPFMVNDSEYRKGVKVNPCFDKAGKKLDCLKMFKSLAVYHSGFGGSWSW